jgi:hypothetical protein
MRNIKFYSFQGRRLLKVADIKVTELLIDQTITHKNADSSSKGTPIEIKIPTVENFGHF